LYSCHSSSIDMKFALQPEKLVEEGGGRMLSDEAEHDHQETSTY